MSLQNPIPPHKLEQLKKSLEGEFYFDDSHRHIYATDASSFRELPSGVSMPKTEKDLKILIDFALSNQTSLIPRTAGTSLAGQVVGNGIIIDVSKYFNRIIEVNKEEGWVRAQPGVVRDELNLYLSDYGMMFGPETSTSNRAMIGGMIGNNSCGANSLVYGSTRDHLISVKTLLSDGSEVEFKSISNDEFNKKLKNNQENELESNLYTDIDSILSDPEVRKEIEKEFPLPSIPRRNTGYAIDLLAKTAPFVENIEPFNFCKLIAGSEGTLAFITEAKLAIKAIPTGTTGLLCLHFNSIYECLKGNLVALKHRPSACELMDNYILECTKNNIGQRENRFFVKGDPKAILVIELRRETDEMVKEAAEKLVMELKNENLGYYYPLITGPETMKVWELRKAGLGLLSNMPGDAKPVPVVEDTAVTVDDLPEYINEFNLLLKKYDLYSVHYAHAATGELHLRPILDLKSEKDTELFRTILDEVAKLVKKYKGSLSGEHGDGRLRSEFIPFMVGEKNYQIITRIKNTWDPHNIFNPGKIIDSPPMNSHLRFHPGQETRQFTTTLNFDSTQGFLRAAEQCNGSGDCRKSELIGGTMCPSYMATRNEKDTTRARANILREILTNSESKNPFNSPEIKEVLDLCLSCKGCKAECPSNVDMAKLKAEFQHQYYKSNKPSHRDKSFAQFSKTSKFWSNYPLLYNTVIRLPGISHALKSLNGIAQKRSIPKIQKPLSDWVNQHREVSDKNEGPEVQFFIDEFTEYLDTEIGIKAIKLLTSLGYRVSFPEHLESGRAYLSKGFLKEAKAIADRNFEMLNDIVSAESPLIGIEPSAIYTFKDEFIDLVDTNKIERAKIISSNTYLIDEFLAKEIDEGNISESQFTEERHVIKLHGHCHQKALSSLVPTKKCLSIPKNYEVHLIRSGCCGMAGSFGYEKEHYNVSMQIGELILFPEVRKLTDEIVAANGTSCRHQIIDGTGHKALHTVEILWEALKPEFKI